jgi:hypothetical protein
VNGCHGNKNKTFYILNAFHIKVFFWSQRKCSFIVFAKKPKVWDKKHFFPKNLKEATNDYFLYV